jgi:uncharacterized protein (TIGR03437 family)
VNLFAPRSILRRMSALVPLAALAAGSLAAQSLTLVSGNGQIVEENFLTFSPLVVMAKDAAGNPVSGVTVNWSVTQGQGTVIPVDRVINPDGLAINVTGADGRARANFLGTNVTGGLSFAAETVTAGSSAGSVIFLITTTINRLAGGGSAALPLVELLTPPSGSRNISGSGGSTLPAAVVVRVTEQSGIQAGTPLPNVSVRLVNADDPTTPTPAACNGPNGVVLTDARGVATCDLVLGNTPGQFGMVALVGEASNSAVLLLQINPGAACTFTISPNAQSFSGTGGNGSISVNAGAGCNRTAVSNASFITVTSGATGAGAGSVTFTVAANTGAQRVGTISIAGQTFTVTQAAAGGVAPGALAFSTPANLPSAIVNVPYTATLAATGGKAPYTFSAAGGLPPGLTLNSATGVLSGTFTTVSNFTITITVADSGGSAPVSQNFTLNVLATSGSFNITNTALPNGVVGQAYQQALNTAGACTATPFSPVPTFSVQAGSLPPGLSITTIGDRAFGISGTPTAAGSYPFVLQGADGCSNKASANFTIVITTPGVTAALTVTPGSLTFSMPQGGNLPASQTLAISGTVSLAYTATAAVTTPAGGNWLALANANGATPGNVTVSIVNAAQLAAGTYSGTVTVTPQGAATVVVPVTLTITPATLLTLNPSKLSITLPNTGINTVQQAITVTAGATPAHVTAVAQTADNGGWLLVSPASADTPATLTVTINAAGLAPGTYNGAITITPAGGAGQSVAVTLTVTLPARLTVAPTSLSFSYQVGAAAPTAKTLDVGATIGNTTFVAGAKTDSDSKWLTVSPISATSPATLAVSVNPTGLAPGSYSGTITLTSADPAYPPVTVPVTLTVTPGAPTIVAIVNAASFQAGSIAPGEFVTFTGSGLGPATAVGLRIADNGRVDTTLADTRVFFDNFPAPLVFVSATQVNAIVPYEIAGRATTQVHVEVGGVASNVIEMRVADSAPAIFVQDATLLSAALNQDGSVNTASNGADPKSVVSFFATGEGSTNPPMTDGAVVGATAPIPAPLQKVTLKIAGLPADVQYAGSVPGLVAGVLQINAKIPDGAPTGKRVAVSLTIGGVTALDTFIWLK